MFLEFGFVCAINPLSSYGYVHWNEHCIELEISQAGSWYVVRDPSDSAEIAFPF